MASVSPTSGCPSKAPLLPNQEAATSCRQADQSMSPQTQRLIQEEHRAQQDQSQATVSCQGCCLSGIGTLRKMPAQAPVLSCEVRTCLNRHLGQAQQSEGKGRRDTDVVTMSGVLNAAEPEPTRPWALLSLFQELPRSLGTPRAG